MAESPPPEQQDWDDIPVDPEKEKQARALHFTVSIIRLLGVVLIVLGIGIALGRIEPVPVPVGYVLIVLGAFQMLVLPLLMIRRFVKAQVAAQKSDE